MALEEQAFAAVREKTQKKVKGWKQKFLYRMGKQILIEVVTQAVLPAEYFQIFLCAKFVLTCAIQNAELNFKFCLLMEKLSYDTKILTIRYSIRSNTEIGSRPPQHQSWCHLSTPKHPCVYMLQTTQTPAKRPKEQWETNHPKKTNATEPLTSTANIDT